MNTVYVAAPVPDDRRRARLFEGQIFVLPPSDSSLALCRFAREMLEAAFAPLDPRTAQFRLPVTRFVDIFAPVKPRFIHHSETKRLIRAVLREAGCDLGTTYLDVPRLRGVTHGGYLTSGVGYAHHPHRDTWYAAPMCQLNWWLPVYPFESESSMAFHPRYWSRAVRNGSSAFDYYEWNAVGRRSAAQHVTSDTRKQPKPEEPVELDSQLRVVCEVGATILFSAAQLHSTVPNTSGRTRFSIDFRTVNAGDVVAMGGAPNLDSEPAGTSLRDFMRGTDLARLPEEVVARYDRGSARSGELVFLPQGLRRE